MNLYSRKQRWKIALLIAAVVIVAMSLWYSNSIVRKIRAEERQKVQLWSEAVKERLSLINYTEKLFADMRREERNKANTWARAVGRIIEADDSELPFLQSIITNNTTIPVLVVGKDGQVKFWRNVEDELLSDRLKLDSTIRAMGASYEPIQIRTEGIEQKVYYRDSHIITELEKTLDYLINSFISETVMNSGSVPVLVTDTSHTQVLNHHNIDPEVLEDPEKLREKISQMAEGNPPIKVKLGDDLVNYIYYADSVIITQLRFFPLVQLIIIGLFLFIAYLIFSTFRNAEQNQVWIGMAKETAHQLGTPLSSLMAWVHLLESRGVDKRTLDEFNKDIGRLGVITDRFSKIGSTPELVEESVQEVLAEAIAYLKPRISSKVNIEITDSPDGEAYAMINRPLFSWVIENLIKNAVDAMNGAGTITIDVHNEIQHVYIDITDTGKGIPSRKHRAVFQPGFTTKKRGWGLGLSLAKRIISGYHRGKIFVKRSENGRGTTFRIVLRTKK